MAKKILFLVISIFVFAVLIISAFAEGPANLLWMEYYEGLQKAKKENKPIFIYFYRIGCPHCKILNEEVLSNDAIKNILKENFVLIQIDGEGGKKQKDSSGKIVTERQLAKDYGVAAYPLVWFLQPDGKQIYKITGVFEVKDYQQFINYVASGWYKKMDIRQYLTKKPEGAYKE